MRICRNLLIDSVGTCKIKWVVVEECIIYDGRRKYMIDGQLMVKDTAEKWELTIWGVRILCMEGKFEGATKFIDMWVIPVDVVKPTDSRLTTGEYKNWRKFFKIKVRMT